MTAIPDELVIRPNFPRRDWTIETYRSRTDPRFPGAPLVSRTVVHSVPALQTALDRAAGTGRIVVSEGMPADHKCNGFCGGLTGGAAS
jgi:hypothetical protein